MRWRVSVWWWLSFSLGIAGFLASLVLPPVLRISPDVVGIALQHLPAVEVSIQRTLGLLWWMFWWWIGEVVPLPVTALLPAVVGPLLGLVSADGTAEPLTVGIFLRGYADPVILLFLGSFLIAEGMRKHGLDRWLALRLLSWRWALRSPRHLLGAIMLGTAAISMWVNNTATAAMVMPLVVGIVELLRRQSSKAVHGISPESLVLAVAWAASIGGMMTVVGTAPNGIALGILRQHGVSVSFVEWLGIGLPVGVLLLSVGWALLAWRGGLPRVSLYEIQAQLQQEYGAGAGLSSAARRTVIVFAGVVLGWIGLPGLLWLFPALEGLELWNIALCGAVLLFLIPAGKGLQPILDWEDLQRIDWGTLLLFGGGLTLSALMTQTGTAQILTHTLVEILAGLPPVIVVGGVLLGANFATELMSNTALASLLLPLLASSLPHLGLPLTTPVIAAAMVSSCAFMLPMGTPPNAIAYGTRLLSLPFMVRVGLLMNLLSTAVLMLVVLVA